MVQLSCKEQPIPGYLSIGIFRQTRMPAFQRSVVVADDLCRGDNKTQWVWGDDFTLEVIKWFNKSRTP